MMRTNNHRPKRNPESGVTLIELVIAGVVLVFGMLSVMAVLATAVGNNGRSKVDSTATMLTQAVVEQISAVLQGGGPGSITDCQLVNGVPSTGSTWTINTTAGSPPTGSGAALAGDVIDFTQSNPPAGFHMDYVECNGNVQTTYDVRWNIQTMSSNGTFLVTVGARPKSNLPNRFSFALPVTMRTYVGGS
ncbi:MAG TPA: hypothetical protein VFB00_03780 [Terriglobales bacterium]|nr:hypothetical protein [Terriglobales bacterium]